MAERSGDLRSDVAVLRRRWPVVVAVTLLGAVLAIAYAATVPVPLTSRALVLLSNGGASGGDGASSAIETQVQIALSTPVLAEAGRSVTPPLSASEVMDRVSVQGATTQLIQIDATSPRPDEAQKLAQGVASAYVTKITDNARSVTGAIIGDLKTRQDALFKQVDGLTHQLNIVNDRLSTEKATSPQGLRDQQLKAQLTAASADIATQLDKVKSQLAASGSIGGTSALASIIQPAAPATGPGRLPGLVTWGLVGAVLGAVIAAVVVTVRARRNPRLRARDDIADAVGSNVLADVRSRPQRSVAEWSALFETYMAAPVDAWAFRQLLRALATMQAPARLAGSGARAARIEHPRSIAVITVAGDPRGLAIAPQLAAFAASLGIATRFVAASGHDTAASLWAACSGERPGSLRPGLRLEARSEAVGTAEILPPGAEDWSFDEVVNGGAPPPVEPAGSTDAPESSTSRDVEGAGTDRRDHLGTALDDSDDEDGEESEAQEYGPTALPSPRRQPAPQVQVAPRHSAAALTVVLAVVEPKEPRLSTLPSTAVTVLALAPGVTTREDLARLAVAVDDAGRRIDGLVVADPDAADRTTGRHTLDERARQAPLPLRVTGMGQASSTNRERGMGG